MSEPARQVSIIDAQTHLPGIIERVENGEQITITRDGTPVARISPVSPRQQRAGRGAETAPADGKPGKYPRPSPVPALPEFDLYPGKWVAVKDRQVVAVADTPRELLYRVQALGVAGQAIFRYVPPDDDVIVIL